MIEQPTPSVVDVAPIPERPAPPPLPDRRRETPIRFGLTLVAAASLHLAVFAGLFRHIAPLPSSDPIAAAAVVEIITVAAAPSLPLAPAMQSDPSDPDPVATRVDGPFQAMSDASATSDQPTEQRDSQKDDPSPERNTGLIVSAASAAPAPPLPPQRPTRAVFASKPEASRDGAAAGVRKPRQAKGERQPVSPVADLQSSSPNGSPGAGQTAGEAAVEAWRTKVRSRIVQAKHYPAAARPERAEGVVRVRITIAADGSLAAADLVQSSGSEVLDGEGLAVMRRAAPYPPPPQGVSGSIVVPISYKLRD